MARVQVDEELKKAFKDLQVQMIDTKQKIKMANLQIDELKRQKTRADLTWAEVSALNPETKLYRALGHMFLSITKDNVHNLLKSMSDNSEERIKSFESSKRYLGRSLKDSENNLREMIQQRKEKEEAEKAK